MFSAGRSRGSHLHRSWRGFNDQQQPTRWPDLHAKRCDTPTALRHPGLTPPLSFARLSAWSDTVSTQSINGGSLERDKPARPLAKSPPDGEQKCGRLTPEHLYLGICADPFDRCRCVDAQAPWTSQRNGPTRRRIVTRNEGTRHRRHAALRADTVCRSERARDRARPHARIDGQGAPCRSIVRIQPLEAMEKHRRRRRGYHYAAIGPLESANTVMRWARRMYERDSLLQGRCGRMRLT